MDDQERHRLATRYRRFAEEEARGRSPRYESFARGVAGDAEVLDFLASLPDEKRQPNLLLAAVRHLHGVAADWPRFRAALLDDCDAVRAVMLARSTQTNEPARSAVLLPVLSRLPQPIALIEVGASAGLCLLPDFYGYDYGRRALAPRPLSVEAPMFPCRGRCRRRCPSSCGVPASISIRSMPPIARRRRGSRRWSGPSRASAWTVYAAR
jgi:hypothetical protein